MEKTFWLWLGCTVLSLPLSGQNQSATVLKEYDQAIDQVAERAMESVVEIEVTGYGVPENDKDREVDNAGPGTATITRLGSDCRP